MDVKHVTHFTLLNKINIEDLNRSKKGFIIYRYGLLKAQDTFKINQKIPENQYHN